MKSKYFFMIGVCVAAFLVFFIIAMLMEKPAVESEPEVTLPAPTEQTIKGFKMPHITQGRKDWEIVGEEAHRKEGSDVVDVISPIITVWTSDKGPKNGVAAPPDRVSTITAPAAQLNVKSEDALLTGGVTIIVHDATNKEEGKVKAQELRWRSKDQMAITDGPAEIRRADMVITGTGMKADIRAGVFEILHNVRIELVPTMPPAKDKAETPPAKSSR